MAIAVAFTLALAISTVQANYDSDCQDGWSSCDSSLWVSPKYHPEDPLSPYTPGEIRGPLEYEIKFSCRGRRNGYYADLDHSCKVWHYCNTTREINPINGLSTWTYMHFSYACVEDGTRYDQVLRECVPEPKAIVRCQDSELYYPTGAYVHDVPVIVSSNNRLVPVRCPTTVSDIKCSVQKDHINLRGCPEAPGAVVKFYSSLPDSVPSYFNENDVTTTVAPLYANVPSLVAEVAPNNVPVGPVQPSVPQPPMYHHISSEEPVAVAVRPKQKFRFRETPEVTARKTIQSTRNVQSEGRKIASPASYAQRKSVGQIHSSQYTDGEQLIFPRRLSQPLVVPTIQSLGNRDVAFEAVPLASTATNSSESAEADFLGLPVGSTKILGDKIDTSFDCTGRSYGYYADVKNQCKIYHVCSPKTDEFGVRFYEHFSFVCAEGLVFDQRKITCVPNKEASHECSDSERYFEKTSEQFHKEHESFMANRKVTTESSPAPVPVTPAPAPTGRTITVLRVRSIEPSSPLQPYISKVNSRPVGPPRVFLKEPTVPSQVDDVSHDEEQLENHPSRGDQSPVDQDELVQAPVKRPIAPVRSYHQKTNYATKAAHPSQISKQYVPRRVVAPVARRHHYVAKSVPTPARRVVFRLKKGYRAPVAYQRPLPYPTPDRIIPSRRVIYHQPRITQQVAQPSVQYAPQQSEHWPSISQGLAEPGLSSGPKRISHSPSIYQGLGQPSLSSGPQIISHNPSISQSVGQPGLSSGPQGISHSPSISQGLGQPSLSSGPQSISHNPSIVQYLPSPDVPEVAPQSLSHNPSIIQVVGSPSVGRRSESISHSPMINQYIPAAGSYDVGSQAISHNPTIHQVIVRPEYSRPSSRRW